MSLFGDMALVGLGGGSSSNPIQYVGGKVVAQAGSVGSVDITIDSGLTGGVASAAAAGDFVLIMHGQANGSTITFTDGTTAYTYIAATAQIADTPAAKALYYRAGWKFMGGTPDTIIRLASTGNVQHTRLSAVAVFRNVDPVTPIDVAQVSATSAATLNADPGSISAAATACVVAFGAAVSDAAIGSNYSSSDLTDFQTAGFGSAINGVVGFGHKLLAGTFDAAQFTGPGAGTNPATAALSIALRAA